MKNKKKEKEEVMKFLRKLSLVKLELSEYGKREMFKALIEPEYHYMLKNIKDEKCQQ